MDTVTKDGMATRESERVDGVEVRDVSNNSHLNDADFSDMMARRFTQKYNLDELLTAEEVFSKVLANRNAGFGGRL